MIVVLLAGAPRYNASPICTERAKLGNHVFREQFVQSLNKAGQNRQLLPEEIADRSAESAA